MIKKISTLIIISLSLFACDGLQQTNNLSHTKFSDISFENASAITENSSSHWLERNTIYVVNHLDNNLYLLLSANKDLEPIVLTAATLSVNLADTFPHLAGKGKAYSLPKNIDDNVIKQLLKAQLLLVGVSVDHEIISATNMQIGNVIDDLYTSASDDADEITDLGSTLSAQGTQFKLWAPTAKSVSVLLFNQDKSEHELQEIELSQNLTTGAWQELVKQPLMGMYYQYKIEVFHPESQQVETLITTDPYSLSLSANSEYSQVTDLNNPLTKPLGWDEQANPTVANVEDNIFYELHIGDFSGTDNSVADHQAKGKYKAFAEQNSDGINHLKLLKQAGLNNIHLLPAFDIGTVNEVKEQRITLTDKVEKLCSIYAKHSLCQNAELNNQQTLLDILNSYDPASSEAEKMVSELREIDDYNWGYDPFHYTVPEGSYALNPEGNARIVEFRDMVQNIHNLGFRVIMDVVYNHTHQAGLKGTSVLDKIVPGYYQRLNPVTGLVEQSTCCDNTATERKMMAKLMTDSLVVWARDYKIDGFRFDLMAHQPKSVMLQAREAVIAVDPDTYFYGEGWNFGEVANNQRFVQASQLELGGTEIGTFTDRLRDAVRGGGMTESGDEIRKLQGIGNGLYTLPNELRSQADSQQHYLLLADQLRVGLAGNLANFPLTNAQNEQVTGKDIPYGDQPSGYALDPADTINYVSKHDNQTLWDNNQYRNDFSLSIDDRVRLHTLSLSYPLLAQGIPFLHMGSELLRSKSYLRDSYDYGHWFNKVDFAMQSNNYNVGLPPHEKDQQNWQVISKVINKNAGRDLVKAKHIEFSRSRFIELLKIRSSINLFRLTTAEAINSQLKFLNTGSEQELGLIVMSLTDKDDIDKEHQQIVVVFNSSAKQQTFAFEGAETFTLHQVQATSSDQLIRESLADENGFTVNKFSTAVFVK
ncbi:pullulanase-type alpha-1,6-glucosidase [Thalassotalea psychrophila]|uniref:Pullulanase-type alpha-1,6-glucosidase n=1 Tax=Thalassotalea psychrophila TaxID=3065647 RepID=A0ABY9TTY9_9GAMM|nr:pullulanase-type alpha-1,6-glucosidase [Colwelliaceae bacterium SQ149]